MLFSNQRTYNLNQKPKVSFMMYLVNLFVGVDQLGNVVAGGDPDNTISARVGYYTQKYYADGKVPLKWRILRSIIDFTFYPVDGKDHCKEAYFNDAGEEFDPGTNDVAVAILALIIIVTCIFIAMGMWLLYALGIVSPEKIDRNKNLKQRLTIAEAKLKSVLAELNQYQVKVDDELDGIIGDTQVTLEEIAEKVDGILSLKQRLETYKKRDDIG